MEGIVVLLVIGFFIWALNQPTANSSSSSKVDNSYNDQEKFLYTTITKDSSENKLSVYNIKCKGLLPNQQYGMNLIGALYIYDDKTKLPFISNYTGTDESETSIVFKQNINFGFMEAGMYFPDWVKLANVVIEGIEHPIKGKRKVNFTIYYFDEKYPVIFENGFIINGKNNLLHISESNKTFTFDEPGYEDKANNKFDSKPLMVEIAMNMAMSDGKLDVKEGNTIKSWIKKELNTVNDNHHDTLKNKLNKSLESSYKKLSSGGSVDSAIEKFANLSDNNTKHQLIKLCLEVLTADGIADELELKNLENLCDRISIDYDDIKAIKDKALVEIITNKSSVNSATDESLVGMNSNLSNEEALKFIKKEYRTWNGRLNSLESGNKRDNAQKMLDALARLREKYQ